ncbi:MAG: hypothetical protein SFW35_01760 [Chitinophagales bacterium]|nr:hypothetical protein [Chitinophagales bacterium]
MNYPLVLVDYYKQPVGFVLTGSQGNFTINALAKRQYSMYVDKWGIDNTLAPIIDLSDNDIATDLQFVLHENYLELLPVGISEAANNLVRIYPNPAVDELFVSNTNASATEVQIINLLGETVPLFRVD